jgi:lipoprotein-anchoring transpeptidase ErfK/SrfK
MGVAVRGIGRLVALGLVASAVLGGCVASENGSGGSTFVLSKRVTPKHAVTHDVALTAPSTVVPTTVAPAAPKVADAPSRPRVSKPSGSVGVSHTSPSPAGSPWAHFDGQLTGGHYVVAQAIGGGLNVSPSPDAAPAVTLSNPLPSGAPRVVVVVLDGGPWLQVLLPIRPNSSVGWVRRSDVDISTVHYRVEIDRGAHRLTLFDGDTPVAEESVAVGKPSTPTPTGQFFTVELLQPTNPGGAYGPYAFTLSAYSEVYQTFGSGDGAVGLHGTNESNSIGHDASHGCVRMHNDAIQRLAGMLPLGTPIFIR